MHTYCLSAPQILCHHTKKITESDYSAILYFFFRVRQGRFDLLPSNTYHSAARDLTKTNFAVFTTSCNVFDLLKKGIGSGCVYEFQLEKVM